LVCRQSEAIYAGAPGVFKQLNIDILLFTNLVIKNNIIYITTNKSGIRKESAKKENEGIKFIIQLLFTE